MTQFPEQNPEAGAELAEICSAMREYLKMSEPLPFAEFEAYHKRVMAFLQTNYQDLDTDQLLMCNRICRVVRQNALNRAAADRLNRKKFGKIEEKCKLWAGAIDRRLYKEGMTEAEMDEREDALWDALLEPSAT
ncbi:MAG: hypothetical protein FWD39_02600 [Clostridiales bacterium]|nr:hypothetical protein [Clostridiales bacterium]